MESVTRNEADFVELFRFAEKQHGVSWNPANDLFFRTEVLHYKGYTDFHLEYLEAECDESYEYCETGERLHAKQIILDFMRVHDVTELRIYGD